MLFTKEQLSFINTAIQARFDPQAGGYTPRAITEAERINFAEIFKKLQKCIIEGSFFDSEVEFVPQEIEYINKVLKEGYPADATLLLLEIKDLLK